jgi:hypothetical protein
MNILFFEVG